MNSLLWLVVGLALAGCAVPRAPASLPPTSKGYVAVFSGEMPGRLSQVARVVNMPGQRAPDIIRGSICASQYLNAFCFRLRTGLAGDSPT